MPSDATGYISLPSTPLVGSPTNEMSGAQHPSQKSQAAQMDGVAIAGHKAPYTLSPETIRIQGCRCVNPRSQPETAAACIDYMMGRLDKVWRRMQGNKLDQKIYIAAERILIQLRDQGMEYFHIVGRNGGTRHQGSQTRDQVWIAFLVPDWGDIDTTGTDKTEVDVKDDASAERLLEENARKIGCGHRWVAEMMVQCHSGKEAKATGLVEHVAVRFAHDWQDWTTVNNREYFKPDEAPPPTRIAIPRTDATSGRMIMDKVWEVVHAMIGPGCETSKSVFVFRISRVVNQLNVDGLQVCGFEVEQMYRTGRHGDKALVKNIRVAIKTLPFIIVDEESLVEEVEKVAGKEESTSAVCMLEYGDKRNSKIKHVSMFFNGEWPIAHLYRKTFPEPTFPGLETMLKA